MTDLCHHDWVGDDECAYCRSEELEGLLSDTQADHMSEHDAISSRRYKENWEDAVDKLNANDKRIAELKDQNIRLRETMKRCIRILSFGGDAEIRNILILALDES